MPTFCERCYNKMMNPKTQKLLTTVPGAITLLQSGAVGVMPTDTIYGLVARASDKQAVARLYALKKREHKPGTVVAANIQQLLALGIEQRYVKKVARWWPNPLSIEMPLGDHLGYLHQDTGRQAYRVVADAQFRSILEQTGPLLTSSANQPGEPGAVNLSEALSYFADNVAFYVDGGDLSGRAPSTIIRITEDSRVEIIREGAIRLNDLDPALTSLGDRAVEPA